MAQEEKTGLTVQILGDLIADISMRLPKFPVQAKDIHRLSYMEVGPGGACNVAIMAARFGLRVGCLGEVGDDGFGLVVREGLKREGVDVSNLQVTPAARTPVAGVVVDKAGEPGYLGYEGSLQIRSWPSKWAAPLQSAQALFADGWAEYKEIPAMVLRGFEVACAAGVRIFFDPGPGNPDLDNSWMKDAIALSEIVMLNRAEARRLVGEQEDEALVQALQALGAQWVLLKRGAGGLLLARGKERTESSGFAVKARDATGAGDSVAGAMIYGVMSHLPLDKLAALANATGAAKVLKLGTGHNMPTLPEIASVLISNGLDPDEFLPSGEQIA
ncbi:MAG: carbohydrate kinase family protein [Chloroflexi bacterium]|nr:carbohydrate kinase family protein [Chloroflexota bacterium]